MKVKCQI